MKTTRQAWELLWRRILPNYATGLWGVGRLFTVGWLDGRQRGLLYDINRFYGTLTDYPPPRLPVQPITEVIAEEPGVALLDPVARNGNVSLLELLVLIHLVRAARPRVIFEIGTFDGRTALNLAANAPETATVLTLDLPAAAWNSTALPLAPGEDLLVKKESSGERFRTSPWGRKIRQLHGDSASFDFSPWHGGADFVFIDGSHSLEYVRNDTEKALALLRDGHGVIVWHDYGQMPGVTTHLNDLHATGGHWAGLRQIEGTALAWICR